MLLVCRHLVYRKQHQLWAEGDEWRARMGIELALPSENVSNLVTDVTSLCITDGNDNCELLTDTFTDCDLQLSAVVEVCISVVV